MIFSDYLFGSYVGSLLVGIALGFTLGFIAWAIEFCNQLFFCFLYVHVIVCTIFLFNSDRLYYRFVSFCTVCHVYAIFTG